MLQDTKKKTYPSKVKTPDQQAAARMVNLYTQAAGGGCFYGALNAQLRDGRPSKTYKDYAQLLNEAIDMLGPILNKGTKFFGLSSSYAKTFRGTGRCDEITKPGPATLKAFTSTSTDPSVPLGFDCNNYILFKNIKGLDVSSLSAIPGEKEILLKSNYPLKVKKYITDKAGIKSELKSHVKNPAHLDKIKTVIVAEG